jgi:hypothetical protein
MFLHQGFFKFKAPHQHYNLQGTGFGIHHSRRCFVGRFNIFHRSMGEKSDLTGFGKKSSLCRSIKPAGKKEKTKQGLFVHTILVDKREL